MVNGAAVSGLASVAMLTLMVAEERPVTISRPEPLPT